MEEENDRLRKLIDEQKELYKKVNNQLKDTEKLEEQEKSKFHKLN